ncbi:HugZ family pyridoxamine 5'-phosphate oxidase [Anaeromyxobacter paludicola]|uniref:CREG-like beta-barrel domain-containing protein n=1 Tax=Anaeromyxobacter paludicola TaxID=2918171 RepID=A0ABM7XEZ8_9BACT|nr:CREG family protein [Anaeromyxobacter paludicola]BDG10481.1 hypothetical protein AMPC_35940 [Anaeromyxobacter paludicola]
MAEEPLESGGPAERARAVLRLLTQERTGVLATLSAREQGWPFGSLTPYALDGDGQPLFLMSGLAQHTRNVLADPRACLFVADAGARDDPQTGARAALLGRVAAVPEAELAPVKERYLARHPETEPYFELGDFRLYRLAVEKAHYVGGFAQAGWVSGGEYRGAR